jgi:hypothetical protein
VRTIQTPQIENTALQIVKIAGTYNYHSALTRIFATGLFAGMDLIIKYYFDELQFQRVKWFYFSDV